jgi:hypothetical protein
VSPRRLRHYLTTPWARLPPVLDVLEVSPWNGEPRHEDNPEDAVRRWHFGADHAGNLVYLIDERDHTVHLLQLVWIS